MQVENLTLYRGDSHTFVIEVSDEAGSPLDLTGSQVNMTIAPKGGYDPFSPDIGLQGSTITIDIKPHHTQGALWRSADYDVQITQGEIVTTVLRGRIDMTKDITL
ncbi:MAG: hypothetical protein Q3971_06810 [Moraxella sp.]|nr:hypothetical protein [Moraxella sp.]